MAVIRTRQNRGHEQSRIQAEGVFDTGATLLALAGEADHLGFEVHRGQKRDAHDEHDGEDGHHQDEDRPPAAVTRNRHPVRPEHRIAK